jgi:hypothetical protein
MVGNIGLMAQFWSLFLEKAGQFRVSKASETGRNGKITQNLSTKIFNVLIYF